MSGSGEKSHLEAGVRMCVDGKYRGAVNRFNRELDSNPNQTHAYRWKTLALRGLDRHKEAAICYRSIIRIDSDYVEAHFGMGAALVSMGHDGLAVKCYDRGMAAQLRIEASGGKAVVPEILRAAAYHEKGRALYRGGQYSEAADSWTNTGFS